MPEPDSSPSNPAPEGGDFTEALPELQAALQADSDDITDIKDEVSKIEIHTDTIGEKLFEIMKIDMPFAELHSHILGLL